MFENKSQPLASKRVFVKRVFVSVSLVGMLMTVVLTIGTVGYHLSTSPHMSWTDAFHNAAMILSGMGLVTTSNFTESGKIFSSLYALFSGMVFVGAIGIFLAPLFHRILHRLHVEDDI